MPSKLVEPCVLAGTSEKGKCAECGAAWARVVGREDIERGIVRTPTGRADKPYGKVPGSNTRSVPDRAIISEGWQPSCMCDAPIVPDTVIDPFTGSGTVAEVALRHGRNFIGCELNPEYIKLAQERIAPLLMQQRLF
jgi:hypothetical protein